MSTLGSATGTRAGWFKSTFSKDTSSCVEVRFDGDSVLIRDSKYRCGPANYPAAEPIITLTTPQWRSFLEAVAAGPSAATEPTITTDAAGNTTLHAADGTTLTYTAPEWAAFLAGATNKEFARS